MSSKAINHMRITVVIPAYNAASTLPRAVASACGQEYADLDVCIVDDGSEDDTKAVVDALKKQDGRIRYLYHAHRGLVATRNLAIRSSAADLIALLDADDEWLPGKVAAQVDLFERHPQVGLVFTDSLYVNSITRQSRPCSENSRGVLGRLRLVPDSCRGNAYLLEGNVKALVFEKSFIPVSSVIMRRSLVIDVGGFNEAMPTGEDIDLWVRLAGRTTFMYLAEVYAKYHFTGHGITAVNERRVKELVSWQKVCLTDVNYADLRATVRRHLRSAYAGLIVFYGRQRQPALALRAYLQSLRDLRAPSLALVLFASVCGPRGIDAALSFKGTSRRYLNAALGRMRRADGQDQPAKP